MANNIKQYYGNYVGIVVQNNDPEQSGKIKVFVPHITATVYKKWVEEKNNKHFNFLGGNIDSVLTQALSGSNFGDNKEITTIIKNTPISLRTITARRTG